MNPKRLEKLLDENSHCVLVTLEKVEGSTPRNEDAFMVVTKSAQAGTIGGGKLEFLASEHARKLLQLAIEAGDNETRSIPLGPEIGQCCGGRVSLVFTLLFGPEKDRFLEKFRKEEAALPQVLVFGAGHVGTALVRHLAQLPVRTSLIEPRADYLKRQMTRLAEVEFARLETHATALPESLIRNAKAGSAFIITTHDHGLDFQLTLEALKRGDAAYVGLIGSRTKRARFVSWLEKQDEDREMTSKLTCPLAVSMTDKRPEAIALATALEVFSCLCSKQSA